MNKTLLITVGGSPEPIIKVLQELNPEKVIFFSSGSSRMEIEEKILPKAGYHPKSGHVVTPDHEDVGICALELIKKVPEEMRKLGEEGPWPALCGYTGGTKAMSAALVWASSYYPCELIYVGGDVRSKEGLGTVESGSERVVRIHNPWDSVAWHETALARELFSRGQYANAAEQMDRALGRAKAPAIRDLLKWIRDVFEAFHAWDVCDFTRAGKLRSLASNASLIRQNNPVFPGLPEFCDATQKSVDFLKRIDPGKASREMALDLLANALRRAKLEQKYEDATARCYSAIEKLAKVQLREKYGIDNSAAKEEQLPEALRERFARYLDPETRTFKFGLKASFELLDKLGDEMGHTYMAREKEFGEVIGLRNKSILGHGFTAINKEAFETLFSIALALAGVEEKDLVQFPSFA